MIKKLLHNFMSMVEEGQVEIYNEFSLQHELGIYLRENLSDYKVQFERNTKFFGITGTIKHEIDIVVYNESEKYAVELKYPVNVQYPEQMYSFLKDILFMEQMKENGFNSTYCLTMVNDKNFYSGKKADGIYSFFRMGSNIHGVVEKPTGNKQESICINETYKVEWTGTSENMKYYVLEM